MDRGVLLTQLGDLARARAGHTKLLALDQALAAMPDSLIAGTTGRDLTTLWPPTHLERAQARP